MESLSFVLVLFLFVAFCSVPGAAHSATPLCSPDILKLRNSSHGSLILQPDGSFEFQLPHCELRQFSVSAAAKCLKGAHITFMGDSLFRYQYLSLAHLFGAGEWSPKFTKSTRPSLPKSLMWEHDFDSWADFYEYTNAFLNKNPLHSLELLDAYRPDNTTWRDQESNMHENRFLRYMPSQNMNDVSSDVRLSFIQWYGIMPMRGDLNKYLPPRNDSMRAWADTWAAKLCPGESYWPLTKKCMEKQTALYKSKNLDRSREWNFPGFVNKELCDEYPHKGALANGGLCTRFEEKILGAIGTTNLILTVGWHAGLQHMSPYFLPKLDTVGTKFFKPLTHDSRHVRTKDQLHLPLVTWQSCAEGCIHGDASEKMAKEYIYKTRLVNKTQQENFIAKHNMDYFDTQPFLRLVKQYDEAIKSGSAERMEKTFVKRSATWPVNQLFNNETVPIILLDHAHFQPWVYNTMNNLLLNAVCPLKQ